MFLKEAETFAASTDAARGPVEARLDEATRQGCSDERLRLLSNRSKLWIVHSRRLVLKGVALNGDIIRGEPELSISLGNGWQPTFNAKPFHELEARDFLENVGDIGSFEDSTPDPNIFHFLRAIAKGKNNSPGPNGIPIAAFRFCPRAPSLFSEVDTEIKEGSVVPSDFNLSLAWFPAKGEQEGDLIEVIRAPSDTRPLAGKNTDNKIIVLANVLALERQYCRITHKAQNGFVPGRNFLNNLVDVDAAARIYSMKHMGAGPLCARSPRNIPVLSSNDFGAAFPSVLHQWMWLVLEHRKLPSRFIRFFQAIYKNAAAVTIHNGDVVILIRFLSGVLQGCPASAMLFNLALDPSLAAFERCLEFGKKGIVRVCAGDVCFALQRLAHLPLLFPIYSAAEKLAGLKLKPPKCKVVPCVKITPETLIAVREWVSEHIPDWNEFEVTGAAELLGFFVGPWMSSHTWVKPMRKFRKRVFDIKIAGAATIFNAFDYNSRVLPVLSYVSQLVPLPLCFSFEQRVAFHTIYHVPFNTFAHADFFFSSGQK